MQKQPKEVMGTLDMRFTSGNSEPVERSTIKDWEWDLLKQYIEWLEDNHKECSRQSGNARSG